MYLNALHEWLELRYYENKIELYLQVLLIIKNNKFEINQFNW